MSKYTMELRELIEQATQDQTGLSTRDKIEQGRKNIFDFEYPIFDENYRQSFETHFIRKFYTREIGFETESLFKFNLETWLLINMPYFNKLFTSELLENGYNPLENAKMDVTHSKTNDSTGNGTASNTNQHDSTTGTDVTTTENGTGFSRDLESNNPDTRLNLTANDGVGVIEYASNIEESSSKEDRSSTSHSGGNNSSTDTANSSTNSTLNETEDFTQHRQGKIGVQTFAKMLQEHRNIFLRIENQIFNEMQDLFMLLY